MGISKKDIESYLEPKVEEVPVNFWMPKELNAELKKKLKMDEVKIREFFIAASKAYVSKT